MERLFIFLMIFLLSVSLVNAHDGITYYENDTFVQFNSVNFTIPGGYGQNNSFMSNSSVSFVNRSGDSINITVGLVNFTGNYTMFGSHQGYLNQSNSSTTFAFVENNKNISVSASNQRILLKVLLE